MRGTLAPTEGICQADTDERLISLWLHGRSPHTTSAYRSDIKRLLDFTGKELRQITLADLQDFADSLDKLAPASKARTLAAVKSCFAYGHRIGYLPFDVGAAVRLPKVKNTLTERILGEAEVHSMIVKEPNLRNRVLLKLLYAAGLRVSEACALTWKDVTERGEAGQVVVFGKGGKTRAVLLCQSVYRDLQALKGQEKPAPTDPVFRSRKGGHLDSSQVLRIVRAAARRAGVELPVSPHWLRHAHASHALDRGCPIHLVQSTLGHASVSTTGIYLHARPEDSSARYLGL